MFLTKKDEKLRIIEEKSPDSPVPRITPRSWPRVGDAKTLGKGTRRSGRIIFRALLLSSPAPFRAFVCGVIPEDGRPATDSAGRL